MKNRKFSALYVKYLIKKPIVFYSFLLLFVALFVCLTQSLKLDVFESAQAVISGDTVVLNVPLTGSQTEILVYQNRNEKVYTLTVVDMAVKENQTVVTVEDACGLSGPVTAEVVTGRETLFERIFMKAGR